MRTNIFITSFIFLFILMQPVYASEQEIASKRFYTLTQEIRCLVCQNQNIADSNAPLAKDLRAKVYRMVLANQSDAEIKDYLVKRYGEFILLKPRLSAKTFLLWAAPFLGLALILVLLFYVMIKK